MNNLALDQGPPDNRQGWYHAGGGVWRNRRTGETWRGWRTHRERAGHYPDFYRYKRIAAQARAAESRFASQLRQVGTTISHMIRGVFNPDNPDDPGWDTIHDLLERYKAMLRPWAEQTAWRMLADVSRRDAAGWHSLGREIGQALKQEVEGADTRSAMSRLYDYTVQKIVELPDDASERLRRSRAFSAEIVSQMRGPAAAAMVAGRRWEDLVRQVRDAGLHVQSSANTVARTETARAATTLQAVRAKHIGSELFQWVTAGDADVRELHDDLARGMRKGVKVGLGNGVYRWDAPPDLDDDKPGLPGTIWNCRCYAVPILPAVPV